MNKKGFVLLETLVVTIFTLITFTILYNTIVPLLGRYNELAYYDDLDLTYDLYHVKKAIQEDLNYPTIRTNAYKKIICSDLNNTIYCNSLYEYLNIKQTDEIVYLKTSQANINNLLKDSTISSDLKDYIKYLAFDSTKELVFIQKDGYLSYLELVD